MPRETGDSETLGAKKQGSRATQLPPANTKETPSRGDLTRLSSSTARAVTGRIGWNTADQRATGGWRPPSVCLDLRAPHVYTWYMGNQVSRRKHKPWIGRVRFTVDPTPTQCRCGQMVTMLRRGSIALLPRVHECPWATQQADIMRTFRAMESAGIRVTEGEVAGRLQSMWLAAKKERTRG